MRFVDVKNDIAFRKIFGNENKKEILISFLNAVLDLPEGKRIENVEIKNPFQLPQIKALKSSILDVLATDQRKITYIVEMQVEEKEGFDKRVQYYTAKQYSSQIKKAEDYPKLNQVIFIGILDFKFFQGKRYLTKHLIINQQTGNQDLSDIEFNFIELPKFNKKLKDLKTLVEKWVYFIKKASDLEVIPENIDDEGLKLAYEDAAQFNWTDKELEAYDYAAMRKQDERGAITLAEKRAVAKALENQEKKQEQKDIQAIKDLYKIGVSPENISIALKVSLEKVNQILNLSN